MLQKWTFSLMCAKTTCDCLVVDAAEHASVGRLAPTHFIRPYDSDGIHAPKLWRTGTNGKVAGNMLRTARSTSSKRYPMDRPPRAASRRWWLAHVVAEFPGAPSPRESERCRVGQNATASQMGGAFVKEQLGRVGRVPSREFVSGSRHCIKLLWPRERRWSSLKAAIWSCYQIP